MWVLLRFDCPTSEDIFCVAFNPLERVPRVPAAQAVKRVRSKRVWNMFHDSKSLLLGTIPNM